VPLSPSPWVSLIVLVGVPILITSRSGPGWLLNFPRSVGPWILLVAVAAAGLLRGPWFVSPSLISAGGIALFAAPLVQAVLFVILYRVFGVVVHRPPASFNAVRYRHRDETHTVSDAIFWAIVFLTVFVGVLSICFYFGVELPSRHRVR
jgi:uncharacterized protein (DUF2062 family)